jgi:hypothetical protein
MEQPISEVLYEWLTRRRLVSVVARKMGVNENTLSGKLRPAHSQARLAADELVTLFQAIRDAGYGNELRGVLHQFTESLRGHEQEGFPDADLVPHVLSLSQSLGTLASCAARIQQITDPEELSQLLTMLRTQMLPVILKMEDTIVARQVKLRKPRRLAGVFLQNPIIESESAV